MKYTIAAVTTEEIAPKSTLLAFIVRLIIYVGLGSYSLHRLRVLAGSCVVVGVVVLRYSIAAHGVPVLLLSWTARGDRVAVASGSPWVCQDWVILSVCRW